MKLSAVLFDYGMVISTAAVPSAHQELVRVLGLEEEKFDRHYWANRHDYDAGRYKGDGYWRKVAMDAGISVTSAQIEKLIAADVRMWSGINLPVLEWARSVGRTGMRTGILSNMCFELAMSLPVNFPWVEEFPYSTWSCHAGSAKPEPAIYQHALDTIGVPAQEVLFLDDRAENIHAAGAAGMQGIVFRDFLQLNNDLNRLGIAELLPPVPDDAIHA